MESQHAASSFKRCGVPPPVFGRFHEGKPCRRLRGPVGPVQISADQTVFYTAARSEAAGNWNCPSACINQETRHNFAMSAGCLQANPPSTFMTMGGDQSHGRQKCGAPLDSNTAQP